ncbi:MAG: ArsR family transcriptional regulator, partial [Deltaproteobacteria bacterium]|nr:ArsR family transcriptional regulator [Deltaproteobacteria bacterium]
MPPTIFPTGVTIYDPDKAHNCYVLFDGRDGRSYLIDMNSNEVNTWPYKGFPTEMIDPAFNEG